MLSAVAARKASKSLQDPTQTVESADLSTMLPLPLLSSKSRQKRKPSQSQKPGSKPKKARKLKPFEKSNVRKEDTDFVRRQVGAIQVQSDSEDISILDNTDDEGFVAPSLVDASGDASSDNDSMNEDAELDLSILFPQLSQTSRRGGDGVNLSTFKPVTNRNLFFLGQEESYALGLASSATLVCFNDDSESLCLLGKCQITVMTGTLELCGTILPAGPTQHSIFACRSHPLPILRSRPSNTPKTIFSGRLKDANAFRTVIAIQDLATGVETLGKACKPFEGMFEPSRWQQSVSSRPFGLNELYMVARATKDLLPLTMPGSWSAALERIAQDEGDGSSTPIFLVKGPKNAGKSSFGRMLVNRLLERYGRVAFLDCDLGQSEFTPPGIVSLNIVSRPVFGPPFTHPSQPYCAHYVGSTTPRSTPSHYLDTVSALLQSYRLYVQIPTSGLEDTDSDPRILHSIPLVVNTMGWVKGLGADLNQLIESAVEPTHIFDIQQVVEETLYSGSHLEALGSFGAYGSTMTPMPSKAKTFLLQPISSAVSSILTSGLTGADHRNISILSYFHASFPSNTDIGSLDEVVATKWNASKPLCAMPPYEVECAIAFDRVVLTGAGSEDVVEEEIERVLNGAIVGLVTCEPDTMEVPEANAFGIPYTKGFSPPSPTSSKCIGLALVRGVSHAVLPNDASASTHVSTKRSSTKRILHLLTPVPPSLLKHTRVLVKGELELPVWGMLDFRTLEESGTAAGKVAGVQWGNVPYLQWGKAPDGAHGAEKRKVRRNLMRRGQM